MNRQEYDRRLDVLLREMTSRTARGLLVWHAVENPRGGRVAFARHGQMQFALNWPSHADKDSELFVDGISLWYGGCEGVRKLMIAIVDQRQLRATRSHAQSEWALRRALKRLTGRSPEIVYL